MIRRAPNGADALAFRRAVAARQAGSFRWAIRLLPRDVRDDMAALYAFCRVCDDAADGPGPRDARRAALARLRAAWARALAEESPAVGLSAKSPAGAAEPAPPDPVLAAFAQTVRRRGVAAADVEAILAGVEADLDVARYPTYAALAEYCDKVAGAVGRTCLDLFGVRAAPARDLATRLGLAMQIVNVLRDVKEDAARGRIYLPLEDMARFGVSEEGILSGRPESGFPSLVRFEADRARSLFAEASGLPRHLPPAVRFFPEALAAVYGEILGRIARGGYDPLARPARLPRWRAAALTLAAWRRASGRADAGTHSA